MIYQGNGSHDITRLRPTAPGAWPWHLRAGRCDFQEYMPATGPRADQGRANAGETAECIDLAASGLAPSYLASRLLAIADAESSPLRHAHVARSSPHLPSPCPLKQHDSALAMEVAATSQMLFCYIIFKWFLAKYSIWLCTRFSVAQNGHFLRRGASTI